MSWQLPRGERAEANCCLRELVTAIVGCLLRNHKIVFVDLTDGPRAITAELEYIDLHRCTNTDYRLIVVVVISISKASSQSASELSLHCSWKKI